MAKNQTAIWNRDDRDLLVELRTTMQNVQLEISNARNEIKEINSGISGRLLNLESNSVSKIEISEYDDRLSSLEATANNWIGKQQMISGAIGIVAGLIGAFISAGHF